jgi:hypothetical protein
MNEWCNRRGLVSISVSVLLILWFIPTRLGRGLRTTSRQISFEFLLVKKCPGQKTRSDSDLEFCLKSKSNLYFCPGAIFHQNGLSPGRYEFMVLV